MSKEVKSLNRFADAPRDKPQVDRVEQHANLDRPGAQAHPRFAASSTPGDWSRYAKTPAWAVR